MKKLIPIICLVISLNFTSSLFSQSTQENLIGKWHLVSNSGGITGRGFPIKERTVIEFTSDCKYKDRKSGV